MKELNFDRDLTREILESRRFILDNETKALLKKNNITWHDGDWKEIKKELEEKGLQFAHEKIPNEDALVGHYKISLIKVIDSKELVIRSRINTDVE